MNIELKSRAEILQLTKNKYWRKATFKEDMDTVIFKTQIQGAIVELTICKSGLYNYEISVNGTIIYVNRYDSAFDVEKLVIKWFRRYDIDNIIIN